jgi:hypothetical protein
MKNWLGSLLIALSCLSTGALAEQAQNLKSLDAYKALYADKWARLVSDIENRSDLSFIQKLTVYEQEVDKLKKQYEEERIAEYKGSEVTLTVEHQCKGRPGGSTKNCGYRCVERPNEEMYTIEEWITFSGDHMKDIINEEKACFKLEAKGNSKKQGSVTAVFKYRGSYVGYKTADDTDTLFNSFLTD